MLPPLLTLVSLFLLAEFVAADPGDVALHISGGFFSIALLALDIVAIAEVLQTSRTYTNKFLWVLFIFLFPFVGLVGYFCCGRNQTHHEYEQIV